MSSRRRPDADDIVYELVPDEPVDACSEAQKVRFKDERSEPWQLWLKGVLESNGFSALTVFFILCNAICVGMETDMPGIAYWDSIERVFLIFFSCELVLRIVSVGPAFFFDCNNVDIAWNIIDSIVVGIGLLALALVLCTAGKHSIGNVTLLRSIRIIRILRILRVVRIFRFMKQLYLLAYGFVEGAMAVFWVAVLASCIIYVCAVVLVRVYREEENDFLRANFNTVPSTMFTLFEIMSSPSLDRYRNEIGEYPLLFIFLIVYVIFGSFGINGLLTGVISESILEKNQARVESQRLERELKRRDLLLRSSDLFDLMDTNEVGSLVVEDIMPYAEEIRALFRDACVSLPDYDFGHMFELMDYDDNGFIEKPEFVSGILELCDEIRPMSIMELQSQLARCSSKITRCSAGVDAIALTLQTLTTELSSRQSEAVRASDFVTKACELLESKGQPEGERERLQNLESTIDQMKNIIVNYSKSTLVEASAHVSGIATDSDQQKMASRRDRRLSTLPVQRPVHADSAHHSAAKQASPKHSPRNEPRSPRKKAARRSKARYESNPVYAGDDTLGADQKIIEIHRELRKRMSLACSEFKGNLSDVLSEEKRISTQTIAEEQEQPEDLHQRASLHAPECKTDKSGGVCQKFAGEILQEHIRQHCETKTVVSAPGTQHAPMHGQCDPLCSETGIPIPDFGKSHSSGNTVRDGKPLLIDSNTQEAAPTGPFRAAAQRAIDQHRISYKPGV